MKARATSSKNNEAMKQQLPLPLPLSQTQQTENSSECVASAINKANDSSNHIGNVYEVADLVRLFNEVFLEPYNTCLVAGAEEPFYQPSSGAGRPHTIHSRQDYFNSALHEVAHWCIAGKQRRLLPDFGYGYEPDGRTPEQQLQFEQFEAKPQALEWIFSHAAGSQFYLSSDNLIAPVSVDDSLDGERQSSQLSAKSFEERIVEEAHRWLADPLPVRAQMFIDALVQRYSLVRADAEKKSQVNYCPKLFNVQSLQVCR